MIALDLRDLRGAFGFGVAGNFAGHLEQAGEAGDFVAVEAAAQAPKGIFPFYAPGSGTFPESLAGHAAAASVRSTAGDRHPGPEPAA